MRHDIPRPITIVMAEDDADDRMLARDAMEESRLGNSFRFVEDGQELMDYLRKRGRYATEDAPRPGLILLDLNMPRMDGWEFCATRLNRGELASIPVVIMSSPDNLATGPRPLVKPVARLQKPFDMSELLSTVWAAANSGANPSNGAP